MRHPLLVALEPVAEALGADLVGPGELRDGDIPLEWDGGVVGALRLPDLNGALDRMIASLAAELGRPLAELRARGQAAGRAPARRAGRVPVAQGGRGCR